MLNIDFLAFPEIKNWRVFWGFKGCERGEGGNIQWIDKDAKLESLQKHSEWMKLLSSVREHNIKRDLMLV